VVFFTQYQQGFRTGGLAVARGVGRVATFDDDTIKVGEAGIRLLRTGARGLSAVAAVSYARWDHIQADLVSMFGFPYTANVGDGRILAFEGSVDWVPVEGLRATAGLFLNRSRLVNPAPDFISSGSRPLPDTPPIAATAAFAWTQAFGSRRLTLETNARYVGSSRLGVGPVLDLPYGNYVETGFSAAYRLKSVEFSLSIDNLLDTRGNRFAIGNPFGVQYRDEETPLRPRTFRIGAKTRF
jgi:outer membrane receptor for monomeric catechols